MRKITYNDTAYYNVTLNLPILVAESVMIFPNPAHNKLRISAGEEIESVEVLNLVGIVIASPQPSPRERVLSIDISDLPNGVYFVKVNGVYAGRFVKE